MTATLPDFINRIVDANGVAVAGAKLYVFAAGTETPKTVFSNSGLTIPHAHPIIANSIGEFANIYMEGGVYKLRVTDASGVTLNEVDSYSVVSADSTNGTAFPVVNISSNYAVTADDTAHILVCNPAGGNILITADSAALGNGFVFFVKLDDATGGTVTVQGVSGQTVDGAASDIISNDGDSIGYVSNGAVGWDIAITSRGVFTGDSGSGGRPGVVPAPPAGSGAEGKALLASGGFGYPHIEPGQSGVIAQTATTLTLRAIPTTSAVSGMVYLVKANDSGREARYEWVPGSTRNHDGRYSIQPNDVTGAGRWIRVGGKQRVHVGTGQSNEDRAAPQVSTVPTGTWPGDLIPVADTYDRVTGSPNDTITFRGPTTVSAGVQAYDPDTSTITTVAAASVFVEGKNAVSLGTAVRIHEETDDPVVIIKRAIGSHPLERWLESCVVNITNVTLSGTEVTLHVDDIRMFQSEVLTATQRVDLVAPSGMSALSGRFSVNDRTPAWATTRTSASPVAGTVKLYTEAGVLYNGTGLPAYSGGGKVQLFHLWNDLVADLADVAAIHPDAIVSIGMSQSEANGGALPTDLYTTVGGRTFDFDRGRSEFIKQVRTLPYTKNAVIAFEEAARDGINYPDKPRSIDTITSAGLDPRTLVYSSAGSATVDDTHFADQYSRGYLVRAPAILGLERGGKYDVNDPAWYRWARHTDGTLGHRWSYPQTVVEGVVQFASGGMRGREYWNAHQFNTQAARIELNVADLGASAFQSGGVFAVYVTSLTGNTPNGSGGTDATAAGRTSIVGTGVTFIDAATRVETANIYYIDETKTEHEFKLVAVDTVQVFKRRPSIVSGSWTPVLTCDTPGNLSVTGTLTGTYWSVSGVIYMAFDISATPTFTTASGTLRINGFPYSAPASNVFMCPVSHSSNLAYGGGKSMVQLVLNSSSAFIQAQGTASGATGLAITAVTSGTSITLRGCIAIPALN